MITPWRNRNRREKILLVTLVTIISFIGGKKFFADSLQAYQLKAQQRLINARRQLLWIEQQHAVMATIGQAEKLQTNQTLAERVRHSLPPAITLDRWQESASHRLSLSISSLELYPMMAWLHELEMRQGVLVERLTFTHNDAASEILLKDKWR